MTRAKKLLILVGASILVLAVVAFFAVGPIARRLALEEARKHGVELACDDLGVRFGSVTLSGCRFNLVGFPRIGGSMAELEVTLRWLSPAGIKLSRLSVEAEGSAATLALGIVEWSKKYPHTYRLPAEASEARLVWRQSASKAAWLDVSGGRVEHTGTATSFRASQTLVGECPTPKAGPGCADVGEVGASWSGDDAVVMLGFGERDIAKSPVRIEVKHALPRPTAEIALSPIALERLAGPFGVSLPVKGVTASANVHLELPEKHQKGPITGTLDAALDGYVPPHPRELDGFVFGRVTKLESKLSVDESREKVDLSETKVTAGAFELRGSGSLLREEQHGLIQLTLRGNLPCGALAGAAADSHLGKTLGGFAGAVAQQLLRGSVGVTVKIDARSDDLPNAKVVRSIGVGCGLKPLRIGNIDVDLSKIPLPPLPSSLPPLPPLPSGLPPFP